MLSVVIPSERSQPAVPLARQLTHQRFVRPGPLVLGTALLKSPTPTEDRDRTVSRMYLPHYCGHRLYLHPISGGRRVMDLVDLPVAGDPSPRSSLIGEVVTGTSQPLLRGCCSTSATEKPFHTWNSLGFL